MGHRTRLRQPGGAEGSAEAAHRIRARATIARKGQARAVRRARSGGAVASRYLGVSRHGHWPLRSDLPAGGVHGPQAAI